MLAKNNDFWWFKYQYYFDTVLTCTETDAITCLLFSKTLRDSKFWFIILNNLRFVMSKLKSAKKGLEKVIHSTPLRVWIGAGSAQPGPPLGPQLGQVCLFIFDYRESVNWNSFVLHYSEASTLLNSAKITMNERKILKLALLYHVQSVWMYVW